MITNSTYMVQLQDDDGSWDFHQDEYDSVERARAVAATIYGGEIPARVVRIERVVTVIEDAPGQFEPPQCPHGTEDVEFCAEGGHDQ